jgi:uncharacterized protein (TIGR03437 family)
MGLGARQCTARPVAQFLVFLALAIIPLHAAPMLRLVSSTVGPVQLATAGATNHQTLEAYNAGDGALNLSFSSSVPWVATTLGASRNCVNTNAAKTCLPIQFAINTTGLPQGVSTAVVTVSAANAVDSPQTVVVLVRIGPVSVYAAPGGSANVPFATSSYVSSHTTTQTGGNWLSVAGESFGSFVFDYQYQIQFQPPASMAPGTYNGSVAIANGTNPTDNQTLPVSMQVTAQPIAVPATATTFAPQPATTGLTIRLAAGAPPLTYPFSPTILLGNAGQGTLSVQTPTITGSWLKPDPVTAYGVPGFFEIDPTGLSVGDNPGSVAFTSNAANGTVTVPVDLQIVAQGAPQIYYQGVQNNATFLPGDTVAPGDILVVKGEQLTFSAPALNLPIPLPTDAGATSVLVNGSAVPLYYTSYGQIAFQLPYNIPVGTALIQVKRDDGQISNTGSVTVAAAAPRLLVVVNNDDGSINSAAHPAHAGEAIVIYAIGLGATSPAVVEGAAAPSAPLAQVAGVTVGFGSGPIGSIQVPADIFAGLTPTLAGLYQVDVHIPSGLGSGTVNLTVYLPGAESNILTLYVE